jgi:hypothetical protein
MMLNKKGIPKLKIFTNDKQREEMLEEDEITSADSAFMTGREMKVEKKKKDLWLEERDTTLVELAKENAQED